MKQSTTSKSRRRSLVYTLWGLSVFNFVIALLVFNAIATSKESTFRGAVVAIAALSALGALEYWFGVFEYTSSGRAW